MPIVTLANSKQYEAPSGTSLLDAALAAGLVLEHSCKTGRCSSCKARVVRGHTAALRAEEVLSAAESAQGWILTCARQALDDVAIDIEDLGDLADYPARTWPARIQQIERVLDDVIKVTLRLPPTAKLRYLPGQYINVLGPGGLKRAYSIANAAPGSVGPIELHIRAVEGGAMSTYWFGGAKVDDLVRLHGPLGTFFLREAVGEHVVFLATGTGIAPVKAMLEQLAATPTEKRPKSLTVYWGCRHPHEHYWAPADDALAVRFVPVASRPPEAWLGARGHVQDVFMADAPDLSRTWVYACGSNDMIESAQRQLLDAGLPARRFHSDAFVVSG
ncbi:FAD-binding oxidoreductase [Aquincola tertiaricarbonis]|uniref:FAD-binding oxidoreductase n=1 Tax=Aquincola tertiaricarbonis TaxID=391953 RepID=A0ABY4SAP9_AQUTE|nr:FAD-binding oxidoreductase [Aquincola tertiaricarbonis]URI09270.1 FAD-binding oxidoreductase [Aquincola tertiaricarbonis]